MLSSTWFCHAASHISITLTTSFIQILTKKYKISNSSRVADFNYSQFTLPLLVQVFYEGKKKYNYMVQAFEKFLVVKFQFHINILEIIKRLIFNHSNYTHYKISFQIHAENNFDHSECTLELSFWYFYQLVKRGRHSYIFMWYNLLAIISPDL